MTVNDLKKRPDYEFNATALEQYSLREIRSGKFDYLDPENGEFRIGEVKLEVGYLDLEVNVTAFVDSKYPEHYKNKPVVSYFLLAKGKWSDGYDQWGNGGYMDDLGYTTDVDFSRDDWKEQLENDMATKLIAIADKYFLSFDKPNFKDGDECRVEDLIWKVKRFGVFLKHKRETRFRKAFNTYEDAKQFCDLHDWSYVDYDDTNSIHVMLFISTFSCSL